MVAVGLGRGKSLPYRPTSLVASGGILGGFAPMGLVALANCLRENGLADVSVCWGKKGHWRCNYLLGMTTDRERSA